MRFGRLAFLVLLGAFIALLGLITVKYVFSGTLSFRFIVPEGFVGDAVAVEDPELPVDYSRVYDLKVENGIIAVPEGFLSRSPPIQWSWTEIVDAEGRTLGRGMEPKMGEMNVDLVTTVVGDDVIRYHFKFFVEGT